jgi:hypothetical protein
MEWTVIQHGTGVRWDIRQVMEGRGDRVVQMWQRREGQRWRAVRQVVSGQRV